MTTKLQDEKVKQESLVDLAKQASIDTRGYPRSIVGYQSINFGEWMRKLNIENQVLGRMDSWKSVHDRHREYVQSKIDDWDQGDYEGQMVFARRYYLSGTGLKQNPWTLPLSRGILLKLLEAQETKQFCRFEIWEPHKIVDPILIGFSSWHPKWSIEKCSYRNKYGKADGDHSLPQCRVTYKICAWE